MKTFLVLLLSSVAVSAANPSYSSFNPLQFSTNGARIISIRDGAVLTNLTIRNSLTLPSSPNSTITLNNVTITNWTDIGGGTTINPTDGYLPYRSNATTFGDSPWYRASTNSLGFIATNRFLTFVGDLSLPNIFLGHDAGTLTAIGSLNLAFGEDSMENITSGGQNIAVGHSSMRSLTSGFSNVGLGVFALDENASGSGNTGIGHSSLIENTGDNATGIGSNAGFSAITATHSFLGGFRSGYHLTNITQSVLIGGLVSTNLAGGVTNAIVIGYRAQGTDSNEIVIGNTNNTKAIFPITSYTGAGTNFLADDGTYKAASFSITNINDGSGIWTNVAGIVQMVPGQADTNELRWISGSADAATNVAFRIDTANDWTANGALLAAFGNSGTNVIEFDASGNGILVGRSARSQWGPSPGLTIFYDTSIGEAPNAELVVGVTDQGSLYDYAFLGINTTQPENSLFQMTIGGTPLVAFKPALIGGATNSAYLFDTSGSLTNGDTFASIRRNGTELLGIAPAPNGQAQLNWGGTTNVLFRSGTDLHYTNGVTSGVSIAVVDGSGVKATFGTDSGANALVTGAAGKSVKLSPNNGGMVWFATDGNFYPNSTNGTLGLFSVNTRIGDIEQAGVHNLYGFMDASGTNLSRLMIYHTGTNGSAIFNSVGTGQAGPSRGFLFQSNGVTQASIAANSGYTGAGTLFLSDDGTFKSAGGGPGGDSLWFDVGGYATLTNTLEGVDIFHDSALGDDPNIDFDLYAAVDASTFDDFGNFYALATTNSAQMTITATSGGVQNTALIVDITNTGGTIDLQRVGVSKFLVDDTRLNSQAQFVNIGPFAGTNSTFTGSSNLFNVGFQAGKDQLITNSSSIFNIGGSTGMGVTNVVNLFNIGTNHAFGAVIKNSENIYNIGVNALETATITSVDNMFNFGADAGWSSQHTGTINLMNLGFAAGESTLTSSSSSDIINIGSLAGASSILSGSTFIYTFGHGAGETMTSSGSSEIYAIGGLNNATLTDSKRIAALGKTAGDGINGAYTNIVFIGDAATIGSTGKDQVIIGPGMALTIGSSNIVSKTSGYAGAGTKVLTDDGTYKATLTDVQVFTSGTNTWTKPTGAKSVWVVCVGGGGGGGSGRKGAALSVRCAGGGGGGGAYARNMFNASTLGGTETVVAGPGGGGGASQTANGNNGVNGTNGISSSFGAWLRAPGGSAGSGGTATTGTGGATVASEISGSGGGSAEVNGDVGVVGTVMATYGASGGGSGGGITVANVASNGGAGGAVGANVLTTALVGGSAGTAGGGGGTGNGNTDHRGATGGGGGAASNTGTAGSGGLGGPYGGGGGGGGAALDSASDSGAGGTGGAGIVMVITSF